ncbi:MAG: hypothetical protein ACC628_19960 [Pirellulaceae bacterium]
MTLEQLEKRVNDLERQVAELRRERKPPGVPQTVDETFGMVGDDSDFDEIVRLGGEYRQQVNNEGL